MIFVAFSIVGVLVILLTVKVSPDAPVTRKVAATVGVETVLSYAVSVTLPELTRLL